MVRNSKQSVVRLRLDHLAIGQDLNYYIGRFSHSLTVTILLVPLSEIRFVVLFQVWLCFSNGNHYDSVYPRSYINSAAICQCKYTFYNLLVHSTNAAAKKSPDFASSILLNETSLGNYSKEKLLIYLQILFKCF